MYRTRSLITALIIALALSACSETPVGPGTTPVSALGSGPAFAKSGTGLVLNSVTDLKLPLIGQVGTVKINQAVITQLVVVQDLLGNIIGVDAQGALQLTVSTLGTDVVTQNFDTQALILSSGKGQCDVLTIDLAPITLDAVGKGLSVDVPQASVTPKASGAVGPLLCKLGSLLNAPVGQVTSAVRGIVNAINKILI